MARSENTEYDFVIVGAGSAGCVLAARLTEDRTTRVLLLEAGVGKEPLAARIPAAFSKLFKTRHDWAYQSEPKPALLGRRLYIPRGKLLGGSSAMNAMIYIRGNPLDYDRWAAAGADGWSYADVLPFFERSEDQGRGALPGHGVGGPMRVEDGRYRNPLSAAFVEACGQVGIPYNEDFNSGRQDGAGYYQVTQKAGRRWSAANAYLFPAIGRPNLTVVRGAHVTRIVFDQQKAIGVEYLKDNRRLLARARRESILAAGAIGSPQLLLLSGVGPADALSSFGIRAVVELDGVGKNLQDHPAIGIALECTKPISLRIAEAPMAYLEYAARRTGPLCSNIAEAGAFVRSYSTAEAPDIQFHFAPAYYVDHGFVRPPGHGFTIGPTLVAPSSRGRLTLRSAQPFAPPLICGNHLSEARDMKALLAGIKLAREIAAAAAFGPYRGAEYLPGASAKSDQDLENHIRSMVELLYHPCGTCKMGKDDEAVVDPELRVRGVSGLRVADASVMPTITRGNTNAPTIMIAERLAAWLRDERGARSVRAAS